MFVNASSLSLEYFEIYLCTFIADRTTVRFTKFGASIFRDFFKRTGQNKIKRTLFERIFNVASHDVISANNNS